MLESLGLSSPAAAGGAVAIQWVLKDWIGEIGKLFFIQRFARSFDSHPKTWKLIGEMTSLTGAFLQLCTVVAPPGWFLTLASAGYALRSIHFSIYGSTHMTFTRNFATQGNVGDIVAKDDSQMTVAHLMGMASGIALLTVSHSVTFLFTTFFIITPIHYYVTVKLLEAAKFEVLNQTKLTLIGDWYVKKGSVPKMKDLTSMETWFGEWIKPGQDFLPKLRVGNTLKNTFDDEVQLAAVLKVLKDENYLIAYRPSDSSFAITFHAEADARDMIKSFLHVAKLHEQLHVAASQADFNSAIEISHAWVKSFFPSFMVDLEAKDWQSDAVFWGDAGNRIQWERSSQENNL
ncbi:hypothetical protein HDU76_010255 [Blyttiomyces sp. JEL0837]|nr:hypothetical protein HDU76_010255 [Blyttiomyces sp. JEL0837]